MLKGDSFYLSFYLLLVACFWPFFFLHHPLTLFIVSGLFLLLLIRCYLMRFPFFSILVKWSAPILMLTIIISHGQFRGLEVGMALLSILAPLKLLESQNKRDYRVFLMISLLLLLTHLLNVDALWPLFIMMPLVAMIFYQLNQIEMHFTASLASHRSHLLSLNLKSIMKLFIVSLSLSSLLFLFFPRISIGGLFFGVRSQQGVTGFSEELNPGQVAGLIESNEIYFRAHINQERPLDYSDLYWRAMILDQVNADGLSWRQSNSLRLQEVISSQEATDLNSDDMQSYQVYFASQKRSPLFLLEGTRTVRALSQLRLLKRADGSFSFIPQNNQRAAFSLKRQKKTTLLDQFLTPTNNTSIDLAPELLKDKRLSAFKNFRGQSADQVLAAIQRFFGENSFVYTLNPGSYHKEEGLLDFLFTRQEGFCEHYAASAAVLFRLADIPAVVAIGLHGGHYNSLGGHYLLRARDAHAWVYFWNEQEKKWQRFDPTALISRERIEGGIDLFLFNQAQGLDWNLEQFNHYQADSFWRHFQDRIDYHYFQLNELFLSFNLTRQLQLFKRLGLPLDHLSRAMIVTVLAGLSFLLFFLFGSLWFLFWRRLSFLHLPPLQREERKYLKYLQKINRRYPSEQISLADCPSLFRPPSGMSRRQKRLFEQKKKAYLAARFVTKND